MEYYLCSIIDRNNAKKPNYDYFMCKYCGKQKGYVKELDEWWNIMCIECSIEKNVEKLEE